MQNWMPKYAKVDIGLNLMNSEKYDEAIEHFTALIKKHPDDDELYFWRAQVFRSAGRHLQSTRRYSDRVDVSNTPESIDCFEKSIKDYHKCLELHSY